MRLLIVLMLALPCLPGRAVPVDWTTPLAPFEIADHLYYVGSRDLASYLVVTPQGNILINANLASSPAQIRHSVEVLGFRWADTKILLNSQAHYDHAAGSAEVLAETHARSMVMDGDAEVIRTGGAADFDSTLTRFPPARVDRTLRDGETVSLGGVTLTAHKTAGHTRGCTTWTMQAMQTGMQRGAMRAHGGTRLVHVVIVGGWGPNPGVRLVAGRGRLAAYPGIAQDFDHTYATLHRLPCDIFLGAHGVYFDLLAKLARAPKEGDSVWIDPEGYQRAVAAHQAGYQRELGMQEAGR